MNVYIKELEINDKIDYFNKLPKFICNIIICLVEKTNYFFIKNIDEDNKIYLVPDIEKIKVYKNIKKTLKREKIQTQKVQAILSEKIKKYENELKPLYILDAKTTLIKNIDEVLEKIIGDNKSEFQDIYILTNNYINSNINMIRKIATKVKSVNIITKELEKYNMLENILMEDGILINISNNKRKSLKKAKIIINIDFTQQEMKNYNIYRNAIIINITKEQIDKLNGFDGIIVQNIEVKLKKEQEKKFYNNNIINSFRNIELYESLQKSREETNEKIEILYLYGNKGKISEKELINKQNIGLK
ncbi:MAG: hypothetical protein GX682_06295 [Clostridiaceae bacterium]|nr:hypothetical protein [Clostridiaceae bacterium]